MTSAALTLTDSNFDDEISSSDSPYLVEFWAPWCTPCLAMRPIIDRIAERGGDALRVGVLNIVDHPLTAERFAVASVPALLVFQEDEVVMRIFGARPERQLLLQLADLLPPAAAP